MKKKILIFVSLFSAIVPCIIFGSNLKADASITSITDYIYFNCFDSKQTTITKLRDLFDEYADGNSQLFYTGEEDSNYYFYHLNDTYRIEYDDYTLFSSNFTGNNGWNPLYSGGKLPVDMVSVPEFLNDATSLISNTSFNVELKEEDDDVISLKSLIGPLYNGYYFGYVDGDFTVNSSIGEFNKEYNEFVYRNSIMLDYFVKTIKSDLGSSERYDIQFMFGETVKISELDLSVCGINSIEYFYSEDDSILSYKHNIVDYRSLTNLKFDLNYPIDCIRLTILNYDEFLEFNGTLIFHGINELYTQGYNDGYNDGHYDGYHDGYDNALDDNDIRDEYYNKGFDDGAASVDITTDNDRAFEAGYSQGVVEAFDEENISDYYKEYFNSGYHDGYRVGKDDAEKAVISFKNILSYMWLLPVDFLKSLLDYEIWGMNFYNLFKFIVSVGLVMGILNLLRFNFSINVSNSHSRSQSRNTSKNTSTNSSTNEIKNTSFNNSTTTNIVKKKEYNHDL